MPKLITFLWLSSDRKALVREAVFYLCRAWFLVRFRRFSIWSKKLGQPIPGDYIDENVAIPDVALEIRWSILAVNRLFRSKFTCLMEAMAGKEMLRKRGLPNAIVLGATLDTPDQSKAMLAHAWLRVGSRIVLGEEEKAKYNAIVSYCDLIERKGLKAKATQG